MPSNYCHLHYRISSLFSIFFQYVIERNVEVALQLCLIVFRVNRFQNLLLRQISEQHIGSHLVEMPDFYSFIQIMISAAAVEAMCGPALLKLNPTWIQDFWEFDKSIPKFLGGFPRLFARAAYKARGRCLEGIKTWHKYAHDSFDESCVEPDDYDPFFGSYLMRSRQKVWAKMKPMDADTMASDDLGIL